MSRTSRFFSAIYHSATDLKFYRSPKKFWSGFWYLYWLSVLLFVVSALFASVQGIRLLSRADSFVAMVRESLREAYPSELTVTIHSGSLITNVSTPYTIDVPPAMAAYVRMQNPMHLVIIDPNASVESYPSLHTLLLLTGHSAVYPETQNRERGKKLSAEELVRQYRVAEYSRTEDVTIDQTKYDAFAAFVEKFLPYVKPALAVGLAASLTILPFIGGFFVVAGYLVSLVFSSLVLWILAALLRVPGGYPRVYILSMYGMTAWAVYRTVESIGRFHIPFIATLLFWGWMIVVLVSLKQQKKQVKVVKRK